MEERYLAEVEPKKGTGKVFPLLIIVYIFFFLNQ